MTREEAITILNMVEAHGLADEAKKVAIEALSQEPTTVIATGDGAYYKIKACEDAISREELLKAIDTWDRFGVDDTNSLFRLDNLSLPHYVAYIHYDDVVKCIKGLPSVAIPPDHDGCKDCRYETYPEYYYPCCECKQNYMDEWKAIPPAEPKTGHWIIIDDCEKFIAKCSECGQIEDSRMIGKYAYCHCGARMVEPQENEEV